MNCGRESCPLSLGLSRRPATADHISGQLPCRLLSAVYLSSCEGLLANQLLCCVLLLILQQELLLAGLLESTDSFNRLLVADTLDG